MWHKPPRPENIAVVARDHREEIVATLAEYEGYPLWGWKDPRQALTIEHYLDFLDGDTYLIAIFRKPELVARSLKAKGQVFNIEEGEKLSRYYARKIIRAIRDFVKV